MKEKSLLATLGYLQTIFKVRPTNFSKTHIFIRFWFICVYMFCIDTFTHVQKLIQIELRNISTLFFILYAFNADVHRKSVSYEFWGRIRRKSKIFYFMYLVLDSIEIWCLLPFCVMLVIKVFKCFWMHFHLFL